MKKHILFLNTYYYRRGGSDAVFLDQELQFNRLGWETAVMAMHHPKNNSTKWQEFFVEEMEFGHNYSIYEKLTRVPKVIYSLEAQKKLTDLLAVFPADLLHAHCIYHHLSPSVLVHAKKMGIPVVMTSHDLKLACPNYKMVNSEGLCERCKSGNYFNAIRYKCVRDSRAISSLVALESWIHNITNIYKRNLDMVIAPSMFMKNKLIEWGWSVGQIVHIPNYVRSEHVKPNYAPGEYYLYFGRLQKDKGISTLIGAACARECELRIVGTGPDEEYFKLQAQNLNGNVRFLGYLSGQKLWDTVQGAKAIILPSEIYENAPMSILESYACGKPVIGAGIGGIPELIRNGETGILFQSGCQASLEAAIETFDSLSQATIEDMGRASRAFVVESFSERKYLRSLLELYCQIGVKLNSSDWGYLA